MTDAPIHFRVEKAFYDELTQRVPTLLWLKSQDNPSGDPPYAVIQADEAKETTPKSGVYYVMMAILVSTVMDQGNPHEHALAVQSVREALDKIPRQGSDPDNGLVIHGFVTMRTVTANEDQEQGTLFELNVGCGVLERDGAVPVVPPDEPLPNEDG
jgi:hypothetical protein